MYRRYSHVGEGAMPVTTMKRNRIKNAVLLLLVIALVALLIISIPALRNREETRSLYVRRIQSEIEDAVRQTSTLSRNAGADSAAILARVRSSLYAVRVLNNMNTAEGNALLIEEERLITLQNTVDRYLSFLTTGMDTGEYQTGLQNALAELQTLAGNLN